MLRTLAHKATRPENLIGGPGDAGSHSKFRLRWLGPVCIDNSKCCDRSQSYRAWWNTARKRRLCSVGVVDSRPQVNNYMHNCYIRQSKFKNVSTSAQDSPLLRSGLTFWYLSASTFACCRGRLLRWSNADDTLLSATQQIWRHAYRPYGVGEASG